MPKFLIHVVPRVIEAENYQGAVTAFARSLFGSQSPVLVKPLEGDRREPFSACASAGEVFEIEQKVKVRA